MKGLNRQYDMENNKSFLELKLIWKDDDMFEVKVTASNGRYSGTTEVYDTSDSLLKFARSLIGFPKNYEILVHEAGEKNGHAYFSMKFYCIDSAGHFGVLINLERSVATEYRAEEKDKLSLEILTEPNAIDNFQKGLLHLAENQEGTAILYGINKTN